MVFRSPGGSSRSPNWGSLHKGNASAPLPFGNQRPTNIQRVSPRQQQQQHQHVPSSSDPAPHHQHHHHQHHHHHHNHHHKGDGAHHRKGKRGKSKAKKDEEEAARAEEISLMIKREEEAEKARQLFESLTRQLNDMDAWAVSTMREAMENFGRDEFDDCVGVVTRVIQKLKLMLGLRAKHAALFDKKNHSIEHAEGSPFPFCDERGKLSYCFYKRAQCNFHLQKFQCASTDVTAALGMYPTSPLLPQLFLLKGERAIQPAPRKSSSSWRSIF